MGLVERGGALCLLGGVSKALRDERRADLGIDSRTFSIH